MNKLTSDRMTQQ